MPKRKSEIVFLEGVPEYKAGDPRPEGYLEFHAWAEVQSKEGLKQAQCETCGLWFFPQENHSHPEPPKED